MLKQSRFFNIVFLVLLCLMAGCVSFSNKSKANNCEQFNTLPSSLISIGYDVESAIGDGVSNAMFVNVQKEIDSKKLTGVSLTRLNHNRVVIPLNTFDAEDGVSTSIFFADDEWFQEGYCIRATYLDESGLEAIMLPVFKGLNLP